MRRRRAGFFTELVAFALIAYAAVSIFGTWRQLRRADREMLSLEQELCSAQETCAYLENCILHSGEDEYIIRAARNKLGLAMPGEIIFIDVKR